MANKTLLQTRTDYPAVTPIDPDECLILDQQTDQPEGEQSTVATLSELIATGGRTVTKAVAYETLYADSVVNVSASSITITVGSVMRNGSRLLIRRTAAYDGNPVTITPPSGATFEGRASIKLYGQYSFVELERISATVFAVKDENASGNFSPKIAFGGSSVGVVHTTQNAYYQKVGAAVSFTIYVEITTKGGLAGNISVTGLPFVANAFFTPVTVGYYHGITTTGKLTGYVNPNTDYIWLWSSLDDGTIEVVSAGMCSENTWLMLAGTYFTSQ